ncbi:MAG: CHASE3 domain-containing protein [Pedobacter sp.]|jgi:CHASE3 domain sensor protein|uniref:CHASE3 domain-containing protein n=1 Tax=Pedobacter sp. TaxID=1411316 RepID=UPI003390B8DE
MVNTFKRNIRLGLGISLAALIISSAASYLSIRKLLESDRWVDHTFKVIQNLDNIISRLKDAETGQRGYLLTADPVFLEPYTGSKDDVMELIDHVQLLTSDNASQQKDIPYLQQLIEKKYVFITRTIANRRRGIPVTEAELLSGKAIMDQIRKQIQTMEKRENTLLAARISKMDRFAMFTPILILLASVVALVVTYAFYRRMKNNLADNERLQELLEQREESTEKNIKVISDLAEQIAKGNYEVRIKDSDLE